MDFFHNLGHFFLRMLPLLSITINITDDILFRKSVVIPALSNWDAHTSATEGEGRCEEFGDNCPFMGKMPGLVKIGLGGVSGGNDKNDDTDKDENNEFNDEDSNSDKRGIDGVADRVNETENDFVSIYNNE